MPVRKPFFLPAASAAARLLTYFVISTLAPPNAVTVRMPLKASPATVAAREYALFISFSYLASAVYSGEGDLAEGRATKANQIESCETASTNVIQHGHCARTGNTRGASSHSSCVTYKWQKY